MIRRLTLLATILFLLASCSIFEQIDPEELGLELEWSWMEVPGFWEFSSSGGYIRLDGEAWYRCFVRTPRQWSGHELTIELGRILDAHEVYWNGEKIGGAGSFPPVIETANETINRYQIASEQARPGKWNLLAVRVYDAGGFGGIDGWHRRDWRTALSISCPQGWMSLRGKWQFSSEADPGKAEWPYPIDSRRANMLARLYDEKANEPEPLGPIGELVPIEGNDQLFWHVRTESDKPPPPQPLIPSSRVGRVQDMIISTTAPLRDSPELWSGMPALSWAEAWPLGNGRTGAMVYGLPHRECIDLNESTLWSGRPSDTNLPRASQTLPRVRAALARGEAIEARDLAKQLVNGATYATHRQSPQQAGRIWIAAPGGLGKGVREYCRELSLEEGVNLKQYRYRDRQYECETFVSAADNVLVYHVRCDELNSVDFTATFEGEGKYEVEVDENGVLTARGIGENRFGLEPGVIYAVRMQIQSVSGEVWAGTERIGVRDADSATLLVSIATNFKDYNDISADPIARADRRLKQAASMDYDELRERHLGEHARRYGRTRLHIGEAAGAEPGQSPMDGLVGGASPSLFDDVRRAGLLFHYGRYLATASTSANTLAPHPRGVWASGLQPPGWMHYRLHNLLPLWQSATGPLHIEGSRESLINLLEELSLRGRATARVHYDIGGWCAHGESDLWASTAPSGVDNLWPLGGAFNALAAWRQYRFNPNRERLEAVYPLLRDAARFASDFLVAYPDDSLRATPSVSPGNRWQSGPVPLALTDSAAVDSIVLSELFEAVDQAGALLDRDSGLRSRGESVLPRLPKLTVSERQTLREWLDNNDESEGPFMPHLYGVYPGHVVTPTLRPDLADAAMRSLTLRSGDLTPWALAFRAACWARLGRGDYALESLDKMIKTGLLANGMASGSRCDLTANVLAAGAMAEMLLQSHPGSAPGDADADEIALLPALPPSWESGGRVEGLRARGGHEVDIVWQSGETLRADIRAGDKTLLRVRLPRTMLEAGGTIEVADGNGVAVDFRKTSDDTIAFSVASPNLYYLQIR